MVHLPILVFYYLFEVLVCIHSHFHLYLFPSQCTGPGKCSSNFMPHCSALDQIRYQTEIRPFNHSSLTNSSVQEVPKLFLSSAKKHEEIALLVLETGNLQVASLPQQQETIMIHCASSVIQHWLASFPRCWVQYFQRKNLIVASFRVFCEM